MRFYKFKYKGRKVMVCFSDAREKEFSVECGGVLGVFVNTINKTKIHKFLKRIRRKD